MVTRSPLHVEAVNALSMRNPAAHMSVDREARVPTLIHLQPSWLTASIKA
jgi:hypothetical protein